MEGRDMLSMNDFHAFTFTNAIRKVILEIDTLVLLLDGLL